MSVYEVSGPLRFHGTGQVKNYCVLRLQTANQRLSVPDSLAWIRYAQFFASGSVRDGFWAMSEICKSNFAVSLERLEALYHRPAAQLDFYRGSCPIRKHYGSRARNHIFILSPEGS